MWDVPKMAKGILEQIQFRKIPQRLIEKRGKEVSEWTQTCPKRLDLCWIYNINGQLIKP